VVTFKDCPQPGRLLSEFRTHSAGLELCGPWGLKTRHLACALRQVGRCGPYTLLFLMALFSLSVLRSADVHARAPRPLQED
jgi:hypothetical protein